MKKLPRDSQRQKIYGWETANIHPYNKAPLDLQECQELINQACAFYGFFRTPTVADGRGRRRAGYSPLRHRISLPLWARTQSVVLHEVAHALADKVFAAQERTPSCEPGHGPTFARILIDLVHHFMKIPIWRLRNSASRSKIKLASASTCAPPSRSERKELLQLFQAREKLRLQFKLAQKRFDESRAACDVRWQEAVARDQRLREKRSEAARIRFETNNPFQKDR